MEVVDQEMATDEASQSIAPVEDAPLPPQDGDDTAAALTFLIFVYLFFFSFSVNFFLGAQCVLGFFILLLEQYFHSNLRKMFLPSVYGFLLFLSLQLYQ